MAPRCNTVPQMAMEQAEINFSKGFCIKTISALEQNITSLAEIFAKLVNVRFT